MENLPPGAATMRVTAFAASPVHLVLSRGKTTHEGRHRRAAFSSDRTDDAATLSDGRRLGGGLERE